MSNRTKIIAVLSFLFVVILILVIKDDNKPKILFLGNSITAYGKSPEIGWYGAWGMAASEKQYDYAHPVLKPAKHSDFKVKTVDGWEQRFYKYNHKQLK